VPWHNAAADLIGADLLPYRQEYYVTCLDLGSSGSVVTNGWDRTIELTGTAAKERKHFINGVLIAPPPPIREKALAAAAPIVRRVGEN
jgi:NADH dehydrogenase